MISGHAKAMATDSSSPVILGMHVMDGCHTISLRSEGQIHAGIFFFSGEILVESTNSDTTWFILSFFFTPLNYYININS